VTGAFPISHYPPLAIEEALFRFWRRAGRESGVALVPSGSARFERRGVDTVEPAERPEPLDRYSVRGLVWGVQTAWFSRDDRLIAVANGDAELDRFEAIRAGYEAMLPIVVARSVADGIADQAAIARRITPAAGGRYALVGARLIDGTGRPPIEGATILVEGGRIAAAGAAGAVPLPSGVPRIDLRGGTVIPGLWDLHAHYEQVEWPLVGLAAGVTTARDAANELELVTALREAIGAGRILGPRLLAAGVIDGPGHALGVITAATAGEAHRAVTRYADLGFEQIKIYQSLPPALVGAVVEEAHRRGMTVTGHVPTGMNALEFIAAGADQINHLNFVTAVMRPPPQPGQPPPPLDLASAEARRVIQRLVERKVVLDPSLARAEQFLHSRDSGYAAYEPGVLLVPLELRGSLESTGISGPGAAGAAARFQRSLELVALLERSGVPIVLGTDLTVPGYSIYRELELAVRGGFTPMEAIQAATIVPAQALRLERESGTIEPGKRADLLVLDANPLDDIRNIRTVRLVVKEGNAYDSPALFRAAGFETRPR
jgi:imidazolonepropionase-like amidohydrolase